MLKAASILATAIAFPGAALAADAPKPSGQKPAGAPAKTIHAVFECASGKSITANFVQGDPGKVDLVLSDGRRLSLKQTSSGSGARYANPGESIVFWNKGKTAFIEEKGKTSYADCTTS
jgi:membrane-bound inhibitor of C-type lysozyme